MGHAIGIDVGSTNVKVVLVREDGVLAAAAARPLVTRRLGDTAEQDADLLWTATADAVREVTAADPATASGVEVVGVCSQYSSIVPVDEQGAVTGPLVMYWDHRGADHCLAILGRHDDAFLTWIERHGIPPIGGGLSLSHMLHLQHDRPEVHARTAAWLEPVDFVNMRLTGRVAANQCTQFTAQLTDNRTLDATCYDPDLVAWSGIDADRLPPLLPVGEDHGTLLAAVAADLGLPAGTRVSGGMNDSQAGALATGAFAPGRTGIAIGTTAVILDTVGHMGVDLEHEVLSMPSPVPGRWLVTAENGIAGRAVEHVLGALLHADDELGSHASDDPFGALDRALAAVPAGAGGVLFLPWLSGSMSPAADRAMRGGFLNLSLDTRRIDLVRAAVEGTARNLAWLLPAVEAFSGTPTAEVVFGGGAARSAGWAQALADILDRPVLTLDDAGHAVARARALHALGTLDPSGPVATSGRYEPDAGTRAMHAELQAQFEAAFAALRPIFGALNG